MLTKEIICEIHGAGFENKGAELMLRTTVSELRKRLPAIQPAIDPGYGSFHKRSEMNLFQMFPARFHVGTEGYAKRLRKQQLVSKLAKERIFKSIAAVHTNSYGLATFSKVKALIDVSGFAFTDEWGSKPTQDMALLTAAYKKGGKPVILMPQAFGPFYRKETKTAFKKIIDDATLIFARDDESHKNIMTLSEDAENVFKAPDITLFYPELCSDNNFLSQTKFACIVPNIRMLDQGKNAWGERYEFLLQKISRQILSFGIELHILVHDTSGDDLKLANNLRDTISLPGVKVVEENDPLALKKIVARSLMVVGSRYHSLVAAFSKNVPAIALGWSHKYEMLFSDFGMGSFVIHPSTTDEIVTSLVEKLTNEESNIAHRKTITDRLQSMHATNITMWDKVCDLLNRL